MYGLINASGVVESRPEIQRETFPALLKHGDLIQKHINEMLSVIEIFEQSESVNLNALEEDVFYRESEIGNACILPEDDVERLMQGNTDAKAINHLLYRLSPLLDKMEDDHD